MNFLTWIQPTMLIFIVYSERNPW